MNWKLRNTLYATAEGGSGGGTSVPPSPPEDQGGKEEKGGEANDLEGKLKDFIEQKHKEWLNDYQQKQSEAEKLKGLSAEQRLEHEKQELVKKLKEYEEKESRSVMAKTVRDELSKANVAVGDNLVDMLIATTAEATLARTTEFAKAYNEAVQSAVNKLTRTPDPKIGMSATVTKEDIAKIKDTNERIKAMLKHKELYN